MAPPPHRGCNRFWWHTGALDRPGISGTATTVVPGTPDAFFDEVAYPVGNPAGAFALVSPKDSNAIDARNPESRNPK